MQTLVMLAGFWLLLIAAYFAWPRLQGLRSGRLGLKISEDLPPLDVSLSQRYREGIAAATASLASPRPRREPIIETVGTPFEENLVSEIDFLREQLEELRAEISSITRMPPTDRRGRNQLGRYRSGANAYLPLTLRRHVRDVRNRRRMTAA